MVCFTKLAAVCGAEQVGDFGQLPVRESGSSAALA
jgi:hypothetical protein